MFLKCHFDCIAFPSCCCLRDGNADDIAITTGYILVETSMQLQRYACCSGTSSCCILFDHLALFGNLSGLTCLHKYPRNEQHLGSFGGANEDRHVSLEARHHKRLFRQSKVNLWRSEQFALTWFDCNMCWKSVFFHMCSQYKLSRNRNIQKPFCLDRRCARNVLHLCKGSHNWAFIKAATLSGIKYAGVLARQHLGERLVFVWHRARSRNGMIIRDYG